MTGDWVDPRLQFNFLKANDLSPNLVPTLNNSGCSSIQLYEIWTPEILLFNTRDILSTSRIESDESSIVDIVQSGHGQFNSEEYLDKVETFAGKENPLAKYSYYTSTFDCTFDISNFPFDTQTCYMMFLPDTSDMSYITLVAGEENVYMDSNRQAEYTIESTKLMVVDTDIPNGTLAGLHVKLVLSRDPTSIFMRTYLPTIIINVINAATSYWEGPHLFEAVVTVNLTCLMVLAALYISVSESLNVTSKVTYINFWLLFNLIFPFVIVLLHSYIQHQRTRVAEAASPIKKKKGRWCWPGAAAKAMVCLFVVKVIVPLAGVVFMATYWIIGLYYLTPLE